jgi:hypothetical protein
MTYQVGDRIRYTRGIRWSVLGKEGVVLRIYVAHGGTLLSVDFGTEVYSCWTENVDSVPDSIVDTG